MTEYDYWKIFPRMPRKVMIGDITIRDGFQHLEKFISTRAKIFYLEELIFAGCRDIEVTNLGNPYLMPQFSDAEELLAHLRSDRFMQRCVERDIEMIVTTEKDAVRFPRPREMDVDIYFLRIEIEILKGHDVWERLVSRIADQQERAPTGWAEERLLLDPLGAK